MRRREEDEVSENDFNEVLKKFKSKQTKSYDFLLKSGGKYQKAILKFYQRIIEDE